jgi:hypothetical protein
VKRRSGNALWNAASAKSQQERFLLKSCVLSVNQFNDPENFRGFAPPQFRQQCLAVWLSQQTAVSEADETLLQVIRGVNLNSIAKSRPHLLSGSTVPPDPLLAATLTAGGLQPGAWRINCYMQAA